MKTKEKQGEKWRCFCRILPEVQIFILDITYTHTQSNCLPPAFVAALCAYTRGDWGENPGWEHPAAGTRWDAGNGLYNRIQFQVITPGYSPQDRSCKVLSTLAPVQKIIYTHKEYTQVKHAFLCFPEFSSDAVVLLFKSFFFVAHENDLHTSMFII